MTEDALTGAVAEANEAGHALIARLSAKMAEMSKTYAGAISRHKFRLERDLQTRYPKHNPRMMTVHPWFRGQSEQD